MEDNAPTDLPWKLSLLVVLVVAGLAAALVWFTDLQSERKALLSNVAGGGTVGVGLLLWEELRRKHQQQLQARRRRGLHSILATYPGAELTNLAVLLNQDGVAEDGTPITLFPTVDDQLRAFQSYSSTEIVMRALLRHRNHPDASLVINTWNCINRFYQRLAEIFPALLSDSIASQDGDIVDRLLDLWRERTRHTVVGGLLWQEGTQPGRIQNLTAERAQLATYIRVAGDVLLAYAELLRVVAEVPSGIPSRRRNGP